MTPSDIGRQFSRLVQAAAEAPSAVDKNELLFAASAFLDAAQGGNPGGLELSRGMAFRAMDWVVFERPLDYAKLRRAVDCFRMYSCLINN